MYNLTHSFLLYCGKGRCKQRRQPCTQTNAFTYNHSQIEVFLRVSFTNRGVLASFSSPGNRCFCLLALFTFLRCVGSGCLCPMYSDECGNMGRFLFIYLFLLCMGVWFTFDFDFGLVEIMLVIYVSLVSCTHPFLFLNFAMFTMIELPHPRDHI